MGFRNKLTELLNLQYPIFQGGMAWVADAVLASAVSNGGGLGIIAAGTMPPSDLEKEIRKAKELTEKPFGVNIMLMSPTVDDVIEVIASSNVPIVTTGAGNPAKAINRLKPCGIKVIPVVPSVALAKRVEKQGADAVIAEGAESGGHIGETTTLALVPQVVDAVKIPVIAAGGIADGRGLVATFALGAVGVQMGTRFLCALECRAHPTYKNMVIKAGDRATVVTGRKYGHPVRCLESKLTRKLEEIENNNAPQGEFEQAGTGSLRLAVIEGDKERGSFMSGQIAGLVMEVLPAREIIRNIWTEACDIIPSLSDILKEV